MTAGTMLDATKLVVTVNTLSAVPHEVAPCIEFAMTEDFNLARFVEAQQSCYEQVRRELQAGRKQTHWMWFIFPQLRGLGSSPTAQHFAISSLAEAAAYLGHPLLGARLRECTRLVNESGARSAAVIFGELDAMKFRSSMTLFSRAEAEDGEFRVALETFFADGQDPRTLHLLRST